ncbi:MAG: hypothetical protein U0793_10365 [Gemmataceae bacterium]
MAYRLIAACAATTLLLIGVIAWCCQLDTRPVAPPLTRMTKSVPSRDATPPAAAPAAAPAPVVARELAAKTESPSAAAATTPVSSPAIALPATMPGEPTPDPRLVNCSKLGTRIVFYKDPPDAFRKAREERRMVFFIHLSGNFEDAAFT